MIRWECTRILHAFWGLVSTAFKYSFHSPFLHQKISQKFFFEIYTFSRAEKHPSEQQKCENREREQG
jgi:hypothetical protein